MLPVLHLGVDERLIRAVLIHGESSGVACSLMLPHLAFRKPHDGGAEIILKRNGTPAKFGTTWEPEC